MNREITLSKCEHCGHLHPADTKCDCQKRRCVNGWNNKRIPKTDYVECRCEFDGHSIGYVECFEGWCRHWRKDRADNEQRAD